MAVESRNLSVWIDRSADAVYEFVSDPANLPSWAPGLTNHVEQVDGEWFIAIGEERAGFAFAPANAFGVLDHTVTMPSGETFYNPMRVIPAAAGSEVVFTVRRGPTVSDEDFGRDLGLVQADLERLKALVERG
jgi:hypothetical protein